MTTTTTLATLSNAACSTATGVLDLNVFDRRGGLHSLQEEIVNINTFFGKKDDFDSVPSKYTQAEKTLRTEINQLICRIFLVRKVGSFVHTKKFWFFYHNFIPKKWQISVGHFGILCNHWRLFGM